MFQRGLRRLTDGAELPFDPTAYTKADAPAGPEGDPPVLDVLYDYEQAADAIRNGGAWSDRNDVFRWLPVLPVGEAGPVLPAGGTPLVAAPRIANELGIGALYIKDETRNPTRCLKDRATAVAMTMALKQGHKDVYCASAGNAAISLAGFAAHAGLNCHAYVPAIASRTRLAWLEHYGSAIHVSKGNYDDAYAEAEEAGAQNGWYSRNCALNPFLVEGKKTVSYEIAEALDWDVPDYVFVPTGDGCTSGATGKGFREIHEMGLAERMPHLVGVQTTAISPIVDRFNGKEWAGDAGETEAASIAVRHPRNALRLLNEIRAANGQMIAVSDDAISAAQQKLMTEAGVVAEFTSAATLAALTELAKNDDLSGKTAVLVVTGGRLDGE